MHPLNVEPLGNELLKEDRGLRSQQLGRIARLSDEIILECLFSADAGTLAAACCASRGLRAFASVEELWKAFAVGRVRFKSSWKTTVLGREACRLRRTCIYSDLLYLPFVLPEPASFWTTESVARARGISDREFWDKYDEPGIPVVLEGGFAVDERWADLGETKGTFRAGAFEFAMADYLEYAAANADLQPLYLFDDRFADIAPHLAKYEPPSMFRDDLFRWCEPRPQYRWLAVGGPRSGSAWHVDPNGTSAWNATITGRKRWFFSREPPPGVHPSADGLDVVAPPSLAEWLVRYLAHSKPLAATTGPGDVVFVPRGWWHMVVNLDPNLTVAVTHNFCSESGLPHALNLLRTRPHLASGLELPPGADDGDRRRRRGAALHDQLVDTLRRHRPDLLESAEASLRRPATLWDKLLLLQDHDDDDACSRSKKNTKRTKVAAAAAAAAAGEPFVFGFAL
ncbi:hypothetical protein CTAYLR_008151 [Chrysophaeum taylorii]|uniref:JmjC domain-containing protein n=1 Tax=Chrysophaeum taylorii TaxID=2483200 RepID=A0AAD7UIM6_9STRA|nr:hypothetical protein CTAYLR_008151 [Chrysophaeum taylorii]